MTLTEAKTLLEANGQAHVLRFWDALDAAAQAALLAQIATLDFAAIGRMQALLKDAGKPAATLPSARKQARSPALPRARSASPASSASQ